MSKKIIIDPDFQQLLTPLLPEEYAALEASILKEGCRHPLIIWKGILVDGHNRYEICNKHGKPYKTSELLYCETRPAVILWMIKQQLARRNVSDFQRTVLADRMATLIAAKARENQKTSTGGAAPQLLANSQKAAINTSEEVAKMAGVSTNTVAKVKRIVKTGIPAIKEAASRNDLSINAADKLAALPPEEQQAIAEGGVTALKHAAKAIPNKGTSTAPAASKSEPAVDNQGNIVEAVQHENDALRAMVEQLTTERDLQCARISRLLDQMESMRAENARLNAALGHTAQLVMPQVQLAGVIMSSSFS